MNNPDSPSKKASFLKSFALFAFTLLVYLCFRWIAFEPFVIPSGSMIPTLLVNDHIIVAKYSFGLRWPFTSQWILSPRLPKRGQVVVFRSVEQDDFFMIKRVVGLPGDRIEFNDKGELIINGELAKYENIEIPAEWTETDLGDRREDFDLRRENIGDHSHYTILEKNGLRHTESGHVVGEGRIFLMGDSRDRSRDSRFWGDLPVENLIGRATYIWLACSETLSSINFLCDPRHIHWQRLFHHIE